MNITYKQARAHAQQCGVDIKRFRAVPAARMDQPRVLVRDVIHPETLELIMEKGTTVSPWFVRMMAIHAGFDYVVCI